MTRRKAWRYKCDHCGKTGSSGGHMASHEERCTMNPNRKCGMCALLDENVEDVDTQRLAQLAKDLSRETNGMRYDGKIDEETYLSLDKAGLNTLREAANGCPVCVLAAIRQAGIKCHDFSYKTEVGLIFDAMR